MKLMIMGILLNLCLTQAYALTCHSGLFAGNKTIKLENVMNGASLVSGVLEKTARIVYVDYVFAGKKLAENEYRLVNQNGDEFIFETYQQSEPLPHCPPHSRICLPSNGNTTLLKGKLTNLTTDKDEYFNCGTL